MSIAPVLGKPNISENH